MRLLFSLPVCLCLAAAVQAGDVEDVIFRARHAQLVDADFKQAIALYLEALGDSSLKEDRQADLHLRVARCYAGLGQPRRALDPHLVKSIYEKASKAVRSDADALRLRLRDRIATPKPDRDPELDAKSVRERRRARLAQHVAQARRFLETGEEAGALHQVLLALAIDASHAEAQALQATIERRIRGSSEFLRDPLKALRSWTKARVAQVAQHASTRLTEGIGFARKGSYNLAHARFEEAVRLIDACALRSDAERLDELRRRVLGHWRELRKRELGPDKAEPPIPDAPPPEDSLVREYLNTLQRLLDVVSGPEREYRIVPVRGASGRRADRSWQSKPRRFALFDHQPTSWTAARFAKHVVLARVSPESWARSGNYLDASGEMLVLSNKPDVLDAAVREVERLEQPAVTSVRGRFVLVAVTDAMLKAFEERFGRFRRSLRGDSPVAFRALPQSEFSFEYLASLLRKLGADVNLPGDLFEVELANGSGRRLFCARPVTDVDGYANFSGTGKPVADTHFGVMLDVFALRGAKQQTAFGLRVVTRAPAPPLAAGGDDLVARFDTQTAELFADLPPRSHLVVGGLRDPFAAAQGESGELLLIWAADDGGNRPDRPDPGAPQSVDAQVSLRKLLLELWDDPGPVTDKERGFVARKPLDALRARADFVQALLREELDETAVEVDVEEAVVRVPPARREDAAALVTRLEGQGAQRYVVRIESRVVLTSVLDLWVKREKLGTTPFGKVSAVIWPNIDPTALFDAVRTQPADLYAPARKWPRLMVRGLQARHARSTQSFTSPAFTTEADLATARTRTITEGLTVSVRVLRKLDALRLFVQVSTVAAEQQAEEVDPTTLAPTYRNRVTVYTTSGKIDLRPQERAVTVMVRGIPHPRGDSLGALAELVVGISVSALP